MLKRFFILLTFGIGLIATSFATQAALKCDFDDSSNNATLFDFATMANNINASAPLGTVLFTKTSSVSVWCAKKPNSIGSGPEDIYLSRSKLTDVFGPNSGLTLFVTLQGDRGNSRATFNTKNSTNFIWVAGLGTANYTHFSLDYTIEVVKTGPNTALSVKNTVKLFDVGTSYDGDLMFYMKNGNNLEFSTQTCDVIGSGDYIANLPPLSINDVQGTGPVDGHTVDINVKLSCNSKLWSTQAIVMKLTGEDVPGGASNGLFYFKSISSDASEMGNASGIALQMFQGARGQPYTPVTVGQNFTVGNFEDGLSEVVIPLRAGYYVRETNLSPGKLKSILIYQIDYQ